MIIMNKLTKTLLFFVFSLTALPAFSQNMRVAGFRHLENEMTAKLGEGRRIDDNGDVAALVKVVVPQEGFLFEGDFYGIVGNVEHKGGEYWVYVPGSSLTLTISHPRYNTLRNYTYPVHIKGGETYELLVDIGQGKYVTLNGSRANADLKLDGKYLGKAPIYNYYMLYGQHTLNATEGRWVGNLDFVISANDDTADKQPVLSVTMEDQTPHYGQGRVTVDGQAEIWYDGQQVGQPGLWDFDLHEGFYQIETRKADCEPERTTITVKPGPIGNDAKLKAPTPHTGWLKLYTRPRNASATVDGRPFDVLDAQTLPVGMHQIEVSRSRYHSKQMEYNITRNATVIDTIQLDRIDYVKPLAFYFGCGMTLSSLSGFTATMGAVIHRHDMEMSYTFGTAKSDPVYWYGGNGTLLSGCRYSQSSFATKYGYQFNLLRYLAITPQVGYRYSHLGASTLEGVTNYGDGASAHLFTMGVKLLLVPFHHCYVFTTPEVGIAMSKSDSYKTISSISDVSAGGFSVALGVLVNF